MPRAENGSRFRRFIDKANSEAVERPADLAITAIA